MTPSATTSIERLIRRDRVITLVALSLLTLLAWAYVLAGAGTGMSTIAMTTLAFPPPVHAATATGWDAGYWTVMLTMWWVMMIAMMVPSAAPMILLYGKVARRAQARGQMAEGPLPVFAFALGYLLVWFGYSALTTAAQWALEQAGLVHQMLMWSTSTVLSGALLIAAGVYQLTPAKTACLEHCRSPAAFLSRHWHTGHLGALRMGAVHGAWCLGCCWGLMALLFAGGIMNLMWIAGLALIVLAEKIAPWGMRFAQGVATALIAAGGWLLLRAAV